MTITVYVVHEYDNEGRYLQTFEELSLNAYEAQAYADSFEQCHRPGQVHTLVEAVTAEVDSPSPPLTLPVIDPHGPGIRPTRRTPAVA